MIENKISNPYYILLVLLGYIVLRYIYKPAIDSNKVISAKQKRLGMFLIIILCLFAVQDTDYFHYETALKEMSQGFILHFEDIYYAIGDMVSYNYLLFRLVIWGSAFTLFCWSVKRLNVPLVMSLFFFVTMYLTKFSYARASLAMSIGLLGFTFLVKPIKLKWVSYLCGIAVIIVSFIFHKSAVFMIPVYILSLFRINKYTIGIACLLIPLGYYFISEYGISMLMSTDGNDLIANSAQGYLMKDLSNKGIAILILQYLERIPYYIILYIIVQGVINKEYILLPYYQRSIFNVIIYVIVFASLFLFDYAMNTDVLYYRFLYYSILPLSVALPLLLKIERKRKLLKVAYTMGFFAVIYNILYSFYNAYLSA